MRKLLWIGDAACESGFAKATHLIVPELQRSWDVHVMGINYRGDPHPFRDQVKGQLYPAYVYGSDIFGVKRLLSVCDKVRPDLIVLQNDPWNFPRYFQQLSQLESPPPVVGIVAVDGMNCLGRALNKMTRAIFWTEFGRDEAVRGGCTVPTGVVPLGVDLAIYAPQERREARLRLGLPADVIDGYIVGNVNRNQPRKRLDLTIRYFARWRQMLPEVERRRTFLYLHVAPTGDQGIDCEQLARYYGMSEQDRWLILAEPEMFHGTSEKWVATTYNAFDVLVSTTQGEGWGLTTLEAMACGIPCIVPDWSALGEWARGAAKLVSCPTVSVTPMVNCIGGVPDEERFVAALDEMWNPETRAYYGRIARMRATEPRFRWEQVAAGFAAEIERGWEGRITDHLEPISCPPTPASPA